MPEKIIHAPSIFRALKRSGGRAARYIGSHLISIAGDSRISTSLPADLRREIQHASRQMYNHKHLPNPVDILGYKIQFLGEQALRYLVNEVFFEGTYYFRSETENPVIFDCGSNIGMSILFFKRLYPKARVTGFEPDPFTFETLHTNIKQNNLSNVQIHRGALGDFEGEVEFFRDPSPQSSSLLMSTDRRRHDGTSVTVPALKLSNFIASEIDLLKMDIEGAEATVLRELADAGKLRLVRRMHLEYHHHIDTQADMLSSLLRLMEEHGFGYQIKSTPWRWPIEREFQDVSLYFYRK